MRATSVSQVPALSFPSVEAACLDNYPRPRGRRATLPRSNGEKRRRRENQGNGCTPGLTAAPSLVSQFALDCTPRLSHSQYSRLDVSLRQTAPARSPFSRMKLAVGPPAASPPIRSHSAPLLFCFSATGADRLHSLPVSPSNIRVRRRAPPSAGAILLWHRQVGRD